MWGMKSAMKHDGCAKGKRSKVQVLTVSGGGETEENYMLGELKFPKLMIRRLVSEFNTFYA